MSDPAVAALGDKQLDEVDLNAKESVVADDQSMGLEKDVSVDGTENKALKHSSELESKLEDGHSELRVCVSQRDWQAQADMSRPHH